MTFTTLNTFIINIIGQFVTTDLFINIILPIFASCILIGLIRIIWVVVEAHR